MSATEVCSTYIHTYIIIKVIVASFLIPVVGVDGLILRNLVIAAIDGSSCPYSKDIIAADGTRTLVRALPRPRPLSQHRKLPPLVDEGGGDGGDGGGGAGVDGGDSIASLEENISVTAEEKGEDESGDVSNLSVNLQLLPEFHRDLLSGAPAAWR